MLKPLFDIRPLSVKPAAGRVVQEQKMAPQVRRMVEDRAILIGTLVNSGEIGSCSLEFGSDDPTALNPMKDHHIRPQDAKLFQ
jgi:hypothetical protein